MRTLLALVIVYSLVACNNSKMSEAQIKATSQQIDSILKVADNTSSVKKADAKKVVDSLKAHFNATQDEFNKVTWYVHKNIMKKYWPNRKTIYSEIRNDGYRNLISNYYASDWIFHTSIAVAINGKVVESEQVPTYSDASKTDNNGSGVWENVRYDSSVEEILSFVYNNRDKVVKVRFSGKQYADDVTLSKNDVKALAESYAFAEALKALN